ncbi:lipid-A-disaccharide synthase [Tenacibaculum maritimum]|uniref:Lipid-A-disaccharide synthase n=1 Tax=Tenacibaculum maritimum NCIMB 2154 TaxID=1349785 RepID=A0A2H1EC49_9FLAO|nr:lipid-A-disaccharide synthase [Tenacibaculum maritimum]MCD9583621.1 lipid-A-disaccharide synthase [Tenacibaculum maritimum]MCD9610077.1 lipid-A-disaccharide synthase [Tenacibaculum maritimum]MCD9619761.1 lipid-A-disaccharide synthase [Tenacibaculum maritimum]MCD9628268.1 lipid-A-disaccharide synthase [Tenacibaculum maritimum]MCD9628770.1 lipid-A-disaccharide synthase [Tenacibaculum maritimum]
MKYYIISGEASGDLHGSNLMKELYKQDTSAAIRFWGGDLMKQVGGTLVKHYKERAFMGFIEVLANLRKVLGLISFCKKDIADFNPDVIIFIDNSGFNLRIARWAKEAGFKTNYYISPQVWASRAGRVKDIKRDVDKMFVILPFEKEFYKQYGYEVNFVGHPLIDAIADRKQVDEQEFRREHGLGTKDIIVLLPGSRKQEIKKMLSIMLSLIDDFPKYQFVVAGAPSQPYEFYKEFLEGKEVKFVDNRTYDLLSIANTALVASGTATLETALFKVPQVVCYKGSSISYQIAKRIITLKYISLVNLIMDKEVVKELIQHDFTKENLRMELETILKGEERTRLFLEYYELEQRLGGKGASQKTAKLIIEG